MISSKYNMSIRHVETSQEEVYSRVTYNVSFQPHLKHVLIFLGNRLRPKNTPTTIVSMSRSGSTALFNERRGGVSYGNKHMSLTPSPVLYRSRFLSPARSPTHRYRPLASRHTDARVSRPSAVLKVNNFIKCNGRRLPFGRNQGFGDYWTVYEVILIRVRQLNLLGDLIVAW